MFSVAMIIVVLAVPFMAVPKDVEKGNETPYLTILKSVIAVMCCILAILTLARVSGHPLFEAYHEQIEEIAGVLASEDSFRQMLGGETAGTVEVKALLISIYDSMIMRIPAYAIVGATLVSYFACAMITRNRSRRQQVLPMPKFREFTLPQNSLMPMVLLYFLAWGIARSDTLTANALYQNVNYVFDFVFVIQGAAVLFMLCHARRWPRAVAIVIIILFWNMYILRQALVILGMFDLIFGMKKRIIEAAQQRAGGSPKGSSRGGSDRDRRDGGRGGRRR